MWHYETKARDVLVRIDDQPLWVRAQAVDAIQPYVLNKTRTEIVLRSGQVARTDKSVDEVMEILSRAMKDAPL